MLRIALLVASCCLLNGCCALNPFCWFRTPRVSDFVSVPSVPRPARFDVPVVAPRPVRVPVPSPISTPAVRYPVVTPVPHPAAFWLAHQPAFWGYDNWVQDWRDIHEPAQKRTYESVALPWTYGYSIYDARFLPLVERAREKAYRKGDWLAYYRLHAHVLWVHALLGGKVESEDVRELLAVMEDEQRELARDDLRRAERRRHERALAVAVNRLMYVGYTGSLAWVEESIDDADFWARHRPTPFRPLFEGGAMSRAQKNDLLRHLRSLERDLREGVDGGESDADLEDFAALVDELRERVEDGDLATARELADELWRDAVETMFVLG